jgi:uncharacterized protein DUF4062
MARVFVSSTYEDLSEYRQAAAEAIRSLGHEATMLESYSAMDQQPRDRVRADIASADLFIEIVGWRYGYVPPEDNPNRFSVCELEYHQAIDAAKPVLAFLLDESTLTSDNATSPDELATVRDFRTRLSRQRIVSMVASVDDFRAKLIAALTNWERNLAARVMVEVGVEQLPLAWWLVAHFKASHDLLQHLDPAAFIAGLVKWEEENGKLNRDLPWDVRFKSAREALESRWPNEHPSELWLAWMRATRRPTGRVPDGVGTASGSSSANPSSSAERPPQP